MAALALGLPAPGFANQNLVIKRCQPARLFRVSSHDTGEPYLGCSGGNRFDAPGASAGCPEFSACYLGFTLTVAVAESVLHDEIPCGGEYGIARTTLDRQYLLRFQGSPLRLANLTGVALKRLGGHADLAGSCDYSMTQQWALAVYRNRGNVDGFAYMSRHVNTEIAVILFDRARSKIQIASATGLLADPAFAAAAEALGIVGI